MSRQQHSKKEEEEKIKTEIKIDENICIKHATELKQNTHPPNRIKSTRRVCFDSLSLARSLAFLIQYSTVM